MGSFNFSNEMDTQVFNTFYHASLRSLVIDSENPIRYGVVVDKGLWKRINRLDPNYNARKRRRIAGFSAFGFEKSLKSVRNLEADFLVNWTYRNLKRTISWYHPDRTQSKKELNQFLIFNPRTFGPDQTETTKSLIFTIKSLLLEHYFNVHHHGSNLFYNFIREKYFGLPISSRCPRDDTKFLTTYFRLEDKPWCELNIELIENFFQNTEFFLIDSNLYSSYSTRLMNNATIRHPFSLLVDFRNESIYFDDSFNYTSMKKFIKNHQFGLNGRIMRSSLNKSREFEVRNIEGVDSKRLDSILREDPSERLNQNKDLLVFYYNNWCGFCNLIHHKLTVLALKYFKNVETFKIIKIDVGKNDLPWYIHVSRVPSLLFIPSSDSTNRRETVSFDLTTNQDTLEIKHLVKFILDNSRNPQTLSSFLRANFLDRKKKEMADQVDFDLTTPSKVRYDLINIVTNRQKNLRFEINFLMGSAANRSASMYDIGLDERMFNLKLNRLNLEMEILNNFTNFFH